MSPDGPLWHLTMPSSRSTEPLFAAEESSMTYGEYFNAVSFFLEGRRETMTGIAADGLSRKLVANDLEPIEIYLEKHGAFYHPSRVVVSFNGRRFSRVLNVAVSRIGKAYLRNDVENLARLNRQFPYHFLPDVYDCGSVFIDPSREVTLFLGEWFDGYSEFHASQGRDRQRIEMKVWDPRLGAYTLSRSQAAGVFEKAAEILTAYYNIETYEQIFSWHHAAGDFIVNFAEDDVRAKLVTVRSYEPIIKAHHTDPELAVHALLIFLLNMSIRMRMDRMDGTGDLVWVEDDAVNGTLRGFFKGLKLKERHGLLPAGVAGSFKKYLLQITKAETEDYFDSIVNRLLPEDPELPIIKAHIGAHADTFYRKLAALETA